jgi:hypothetical protein
LVATQTDLLVGPEGRVLTGGERWLAMFAMDAGQGNEEIRPYLYRQAWTIFSQSPVLGSGFGEFGWYLFFDASSFNGVRSVVDRHAHNIVLQLLAETGVVGALCVAVPLVLWAIAFPWRKPTLDRAWLVCILAIEAAHSMVEFPLWHANFLGLAAVMLGLGAEGFFSFRLNVLRRTSLALILAFGLFTLAQVLVDYRSFERWYFEIEARGKAHMPLSGRQLSRFTDPGNASFFAPYYDLLAAELIEIDDRELDAKLALNSQAMHLFPIPSAVLRQAALLYLKGEREPARLYLRRFAVVYPSYVPGYLNKLDKMARADPARFGGLFLDAKQEFAGR